MLLYKVDKEEKERMIEKKIVWLLNKIIIRVYRLTKFLEEHPNETGYIGLFLAFVSMSGFIYTIVNGLFKLIR